MHRALRAAWHRFAGWACYRVGAWQRARRHFENVLGNLEGDDFSAYVGLGRVAYRLGDYASWKRECGQARRTHPERYARLRHPFELFEPSPALPSGETSPLSGTRPVAAASGAGSGTPSQFGVGAAFANGEHDSIDALDFTRDAFDDFETERERARFAGRAPIDAGELAAVDIDELARRLSG